MFGFNNRTSNSDDSVVMKVYPGSPVERDGLRVADGAFWTQVPRRDNFDSTIRRLGQVITFPSEHVGRVTQINDPAIVRLRRWNVPIEFELGEHPLSEAPLLPVSVRGSQTT